MIFNKDTVVVKIEGIAEAYYSGAVAYGKIFVPEEQFSENKYDVENAEFGVDELDGKHSYTEGTLSYATGTIEQFVNEEESEHSNSHDDLLLDMFADRLDISWEDLRELNKAIENLSTREEKQVKLTEDVTIEGTLIPKGTELKYTMISTEDLEGFEIEIDFK